MKLLRLAALHLVFSLLLSPVAFTAAPAAALAPEAPRKLFFPIAFRTNPPSAPSGGCSTTSGNQYAQGPASQWDTDNPVRLAANHADKNLGLRGYTTTNAAKGFVQYGSDDPNQPPQLATLFNPTRVPTFRTTYRANTWNWAPSPNAGTAGGPVTDYAVTVLGLGTNAGERLRVPTSAYDIGGGMEVIVLFADADTIALKYTREDSVAPNGYTLHVDNICTDPNLLALYRALDGGARYVLHAGTPNFSPDYNLVNLPAGQVFGTARSNEVRVAVVDSGSFMDPRSRDEWWQIRP